MSRTNSRTASLRTGTPPPSATKTPPTPASPKLPHAVASTVRPAVSFASAAAAKREAARLEEEQQKEASDNQLAGVTEDLSAVSV